VFSGLNRLLISYSLYITLTNKLVLMADYYSMCSREGSIGNKVTSHRTVPGGRG
jgi:hypothetical protein